MTRLVRGYNRRVARVAARAGRPNRSAQIGGTLRKFRYVPRLKHDKAPTTQKWAGGGFVRARGVMGGRWSARRP